MRLCGGRPILGRLGCLLEAPGPPREARPPKAPQRHSKDAVWVVWGCLLEISGPPLGGLPAKGTPKSLQGRGQYEASDPKLTQTRASTLELHNSLPQGLWSSRVEAEYAKRKQFIWIGDIDGPKSQRNAISECPNQTKRPTTTRSGLAYLSGAGSSGIRSS